MSPEGEKLSENPIPPAIPPDLSSSFLINLHPTTRRHLQGGERGQTSERERGSRSLVSSSGSFLQKNSSTSVFDRRGVRLEGKRFIQALFGRKLIE
jgi:hypothetical protein